MKYKIIDSFLSNKEINILRNFYENNKESARAYRDIFVLEILGIFKNLEKKYNRVYEKNGVDWLQLTHWPTGSFQKPHKDFASDITTLTSITYLNDDFVGGETCSENGTVIKPKKGRTLFFDGQKYAHRVNRVEEGNRYTVSVWYKYKNIMEHI
tara:strand:+ start:222 stop:683 length:462 start_codon:yes stop_codon:yes gene_type:complete